MPLSEAACRSAKGKDRPYKITDGEGLHLLVQPNGSRLWRMAYRFDGKQKTLAFGKYPYVSLADARQKRTEAKTLLAVGKDPALPVKAVETFESVARRWLAQESKEWAESHASRIISRVERDALPIIGDKPIDRIEPPEIVAMLRRVEERGAIDVAKRLRQAVSSVFRLAIAEGIAKHNPAAEVGGALKPAPRVRHMATIKAEELPNLMRRIAAYDGEHVTRLALLFVVHTFVRTGDIRFSTWREVEDLDGAEPVWRIPADRMKMRREHIVPLTPQAVAILREVMAYRDGPHIFPGQRGKPMSANTLIFSLYRLGYHSLATVHGFRRLASTVLNEAGWSSDWIERQLAHVEENKIRGIYNSAEWLPGRREMMVWWSNYLDDQAMRSAA